MLRTPPANNMVNPEPAPTTSKQSAPAPTISVWDKPVKRASVTSALSSQAGYAVPSAHEEQRRSQEAEEHRARERQFTQDLLPLSAGEQSIIEKHRAMGGNNVLVGRAWVRYLRLARATLEEMTATCAAP